MAKKVPQNKFFLFTLCLIAFHILANIIWLSLNRLPPPADAALHSTLSIRFQDYLLHHFFSFDIYRFLIISNYYPPFIHLMGAFIGLLNPYSYKMIQITGTLFFATAMYFLYMYTKAKTNNTVVAFLSVFFFSFFFYIFKESHDHMTDIPLTAAFLAGIYFLHASEGFTKSKETILFFVCFAVACLTKWTAPIFFFIPFLFQFKAFFQALKSDRKARRGIVIGVIIVLVAILPWYITNFENIVTVGKISASAAVDNPQNLFSLENVLFYPKLLIIFQLSFVGFLFFLLSFIPNMLNLKKRFFVEILMTFVFCYCLFTFYLGDKNVRLIFPLMPYFAIFLGNGAYLFFTKYRFGVPLVSMIMGYYLLSYFILSFGIPFYPQYKYAFQFPVLGWTDVYYWHHDPASAIFNRTDWKNEDLAKILHATNKNGGQVKYFIDSERLYLNASTVHLYLYRVTRNVPLNLQEADTNFPYLLQNKPMFANLRELDNYINVIDVLFIPEKSIGPEQGIRDILPRKQIQEYMLNSLNPNYIKTKTIALPDGDTVDVYIRFDVFTSGSD